MDLLEQATAALTAPKSISKWKHTEIERISAELGEPVEVLKFRLEAFARLKSTPWPSILSETWRRNNPRQIGREKYDLWEDPEVIAADNFARSSLTATIPGATRISLRNCRTTESEIATRQQTAGFFIGSLKNGYSGLTTDIITQMVLNPPDDKDSPALSLLHIAFSQGGAYCIIPEYWSSPLPIILNHKFLHDGSALFPTNILRIGRNSHATIILEQDDQGDRDAWLGIMTRIHLEEGSKLNLISINRSKLNLNFYEHLHVKLARNSAFNLTWFDDTAGWAVLRREASLEGTGAEVDMKGAFVGSRSGLYDLRTLQDHKASHTRSDLIFKAANFGSSRSVYQGLIKVHPEASNANAYQLNRNLLMSPEARADSIPKLEILVDEVRCTHGASAGKPDSNALFYLKSRGIPERDAIRLLVEGFLRESGDAVQEASLRDYWWQIVSQRLNAVFE